MSGVESARVDQWIWAVRLYKSRSQATKACNAGQVRVNGAVAKAAAPIHVGDRVELRGSEAPRLVEVTAIVAKRVGAPVAAQCLLDHSAPKASADASLPVRDRGTGRPTKRQRRELDRFRSS